MSPRLRFWPVDQSEPPAFEGLGGCWDFIDLEFDGEARGNPVARRPVSVGGFGSGLAAPEAEVDDAGDPYGGVVGGDRVVDLQAQVVAVEANRGLQVVHDFCDSGEVPDHPGCLSKLVAAASNDAREATPAYVRSAWKAVQTYRLRLAFGLDPRPFNGAAEFGHDSVPPLRFDGALGFVERAVGIKGDGVAVVGGVGRAGDEEDAGGRVVGRGELDGVAGERDYGLACGGLDFAGLAGLRVVGDGPDSACENVSDLLDGEVGVDAVGVAGLDVALGEGEVGAGGDVDGVDDDAVGGGDGWAGSPWIELAQWSDWAPSARAFNRASLATITPIRRRAGRSEVVWLAGV